MLATGLATRLASAPAAASDLLFINSQQIISEIPEAQRVGAELRSGLQDLQETARDRVGELDDDLLRCQDLANQQRTAQAQACVQKNQMDRAEAQADFTAAQQTLEDRRRAELMRVLQLIGTEADTIRAERGASVVLDLSAQGGAILAYDEALDITQDVLEALVSP
jgi:Skp family chaperone for outer membrane proteins